MAGAQARGGNALAGADGRSLQHGAPPNSPSSSPTVLPPSSLGFFSCSISLLVKPFLTAAACAVDDQRKGQVWQPNATQRKLPNPGRRQRPARTSAKRNHLLVVTPDPERGSPHQAGRRKADGARGPEGESLGLHGWPADSRGTQE